jgi:hypothetical protein
MVTFESRLFFNYSLYRLVIAIQPKLFSLLHYIYSVRCSQINI